MAYKKMDQKIEHLLKQFDLENLLGVFKENNIDYQKVFDLNEEELAVLIPNLEDRFKFVIRRESFFKLNIFAINQVNIDAIKTETNDENSQNTQKIKVENPRSNPEVHQLNTVNEKTNGESGLALKALLQRDFVGKQLLTRPLLTEKDRQKVTQKIIEHLLNKSRSIKRPEFEFWATEICSVFENEKESIYYKFCEAKNPGGKLYNSYTKLKKWVGSDKSAQRKEEVKLKTEDEHLDLDQLKDFSLVEEDLKELWIKTGSIRHQHESIVEYYDAFPVLELPVGIELLALDFDKLYKLDPNIFEKKWKEIAVSILAEASSIKECEKFVDVQDVPVEIASIFALPYIFKPVLAKAKSKNCPQSWRAAKPEIAEGFIFNVPFLADLEPKWNERLKKLRKYQLTQQPIVIAIGTLENITACYVSINDNKYECTNLLNAVDRCFKAFFALNADFSADSRPVWEFLQQLYGIPFSKNQKCSINAQVLWNKMPK